MRQSKTTLKELTAAYRAVLRYGILCNAIALGLAVATPARAGVINPDTTNNVFVLGDISLDGQHVANGEAAFAGRRMNEGGYFVQNEGVWVASDAQTEGAVYRYKNDFPQYKMVARSFDMSNSDTYVGPVTLTLRDVSNDDFAFNYQDSVNGDWTDVNLANLSPAITWNVAEDTLTTAGIPQPTAHTIAMFAHLDGDVEGAHAAGSLAFNNVAAVVDGATINATSIDINNGSTLQFVKQDTNLLNTSNRFYTLAADIDSDGKTTLNADTMNVDGSRFVVDEGASLTINPTTSASFTGNTFAGDGGAINNSGSLNLNNATVSNNTARYGGAIENAGNITASNVTFADNTSSGGFGGAIDNYGGNVTIGGTSLFSNNGSTVANSFGGAITNDGGAAVLTVNGDARFSENSAVYGGAIYNTKTASITGASFNANEATNGGALYDAGTSTITGVENVDTFYGNNATYGGAISVAGTGHTTVNNATFKTNTATKYGGAILSKGTLGITGSTFDDNDSADRGGAVYVDAGTTTVTNSTFKNNSTNVNGEDDVTTNGGAIFNNNGTLNVTGSTFDSNIAEQGGAIHDDTDTAGGMNITNSIFKDNSANGIGAVGIFSKNAASIINNVEFNSNHATDGNGGAVYVGAKGSASITNGSTFDSNTATLGGGAIATRGFDLGENFDAKLDITNVTFENNEAGTNGGAIDNFLYGSSTEGHTDSVYVADATFTENSAAKGGAIYNHKGSGDDKQVNDAHQVGNMYLTDSTFTGNTASDKGGAIYNEGVLTFGDDIRFVENGAQAGGAIYNTADGSITIGDNVVFKDNTSMHSSVIGGGKPYGGSDIKNYGYVEIGDNAKFTRTTFQDAINNDDVYDTGIYTMNGSTTKIGNDAYFNNIAQVLNNESNATHIIGNDAKFENNGSVITNFGGSYTIGNNATFKGSQFMTLANKDTGSSITIGDNALFEDNHNPLFHLDSGDYKYMEGNGAVVNNDSASSTVTFGDGSLLETIGANAFNGCSYASATEYLDIIP